MLRNGLTYTKYCFRITQCRNRHVSLHAVHLRNLCRADRRLDADLDATSTSQVPEDFKQFLKDRLPDMVYDGLLHMDLVSVRQSEGQTASVRNLISDCLDKAMIEYKSATTPSPISCTGSSRTASDYENVQLSESFSPTLYTSPLGPNDGMPWHSSDGSDCLDFGSSSSGDGTFIFQQSVSCTDSGYYGSWVSGPQEWPETLEVNDLFAPASQLEPRQSSETWCFNETTVSAI